MVSQNVFSEYRMCSLTMHLWVWFGDAFVRFRLRGVRVHRMCSLNIECVLLLQEMDKTEWWALAVASQNVFSEYRMCSLTTGDGQDRVVGISSGITECVL